MESKILKLSPPKPRGFLAIGYHFPESSRGKGTRTNKPRQTAQAHGGPSISLALSTRFVLALNLVYLSFDHKGSVRSDEILGCAETAMSWLSVQLLGTDVCGACWGSLHYGGN